LEPSFLLCQVSSGGLRVVAYGQRPAVSDFPSPQPRTPSAPGSLTALTHFFSLWDVYGMEESLIQK
jgi:hypothetical protein